MVRYMREGLEKVEFNTHRAKFSLDYYGFYKLKDIFRLEDTPQHNKEIIKYKKRFKGRFLGKNVTVLTYKKESYLPAYMINIDDTNIEIFKELYHIFGEKINISQIEYKLDFFCKSNIYAGIFFANLVRYIHFRWKNVTSIKGGEFKGVDVEREENCVFNVWNDQGYKRKYITIYERGPDHKKRRDSNKRKIYWNHNDVDRVRFEYKVGRNKDEKKVNIKSISAFLKNPNFYNVMMPLMNFKIFKDHNALPDPYDDHYMAEDKDGNSEIFQQEYLAADENGLSPSSYLQSPEKLDWLLKEVEEALLRAERVWKQKPVSKK